MSEECEVIIALSWVSLVGMDSSNKQAPAVAAPQAGCWLAGQLTTLNPLKPVADAITKIYSGPMTLLTRATPMASKCPRKVGLNHNNRSDITITSKNDYMS